MEHAEDSLRDLLQLMLEHTRPPLVVSRLEGDAVISYAPAGSISQGQTLVELIENTYVDFRQSRERMVINTSCTCNACRNIPNLDLKFFVRFGTHSFQELGSYTEMVGTDVNLIHRLTKNHVTDKTGLGAYDLYTQAAVDILGIGQLAEHMIAHRENYEHIGRVEMFVQDLNAVWERDKDKRRIVVNIDDTWQKFEVDLPLNLPLAWDIITNPEYRKIHLGADSQRIVEKQEGRLGPGAVYRCAHGDMILTYLIIDWRPREYLTLQETIPGPGVTALTTTHLTPIAGGTRMTWAIERAKGPFIWRNVSDIWFRLLVRKDKEDFFRDFARVIETDICEGKIVVLDAAEAVTQAIGESLAT